MLDPNSGLGFETFDPFGDHTEITIAALYGPGPGCGEPVEEPQWPGSNANCNC